MQWYGSGGGGGGGGGHSLLNWVGGAAGGGGGQSNSIRETTWLPEETFLWISAASYSSWSCQGPWWKATNWCHTIGLWKSFRLGASWTSPAETWFLWYSWQPPPVDKGVPHRPPSAGGLRWLYIKAGPSYIRCFPKGLSLDLYSSWFSSITSRTMCHLTSVCLLMTAFSTDASTLLKTPISYNRISTV